MNATSSTISLQRWRLLGKELRQLRPMLAVAPLVFLLGAITLTGAESWGFLPRGFPREVIYQLPSLIFALGAVGLAVSQEKEQRSVNWLASLPIASREILQIKWWAGALGLLIVWTGCIAAAALLQTWFPSIGGVEAWLLTLLSHVYILSIGLAIAWRLNAPMAVLLSLLAVAFLPALLAQILYSVAIEGGWSELDRLRSERVTWLLHMVSYIASTMLALTLMFRWGAQALSAQPTGANKAWDWAPYRVNRLRSRPRRAMTASSGLLWQATRQQSGLLMGIALLLTLALIYYSLGGSPMWAGTLVALAVSWLGAGVFVGENSRRQARFFADRGVAPFQVWWTRQAAPVGLLAAIALLALALAAVTPIQPSDPMWRFYLGELIGLLCLSGLLVYSVSQWVSQQLRSPIVAAVLAPPLACGSLVLLLSWLQWLDLPNSGLWLGIALPLVATAWTTRRWLEQNMRPWQAIAQVSLLAIVLACGILLGISGSFNMPRLAESIEIEMRAFPDQSLVRAQTQSWYNTERYRNSNNRRAQELSVDFLHFRQRLESDLREIEQDLASSTHPLFGDWLWSDGQKLQLLTELAPAWDTEDGTTSDVFPRAVNAYFHLVRRIRDSDRLVDQMAADTGEIWLLRLLLQPSQAELLDDDSYNHLVGYLGDVDQRKRARRRALVVAWSDFQQQASRPWWVQRSSDVGGVFLSQLPSGSPLSVSRQEQVLAVGLIEHLWALSAGPDIEHQATLQSLADLWQEPQSAYGIGPLGRYFRIEDAREAILPDWLNRRIWAVPGQQWSAGWERQAQQLQPRPAGANPPAAVSDPASLDEGARP